jgi:hypothetical protein
MLAELAESVTTYLNSLPGTTWGDYKVGTYVTAETALDPEKVRQTSTKKLYVMPLFTGLSMDNSTGRQRKTSIQSLPLLSVSLLLPFDSFSKNDVTDWVEVRRILDLRERIDLAICRGLWEPYVISNVDSQPPVEIELNQRTFLSSTEFTFATQVC